MWTFEQRLFLVQNVQLFLNNFRSTCKLEMFQLLTQVHVSCAMVSSHTLFYFRVQYGILCILYMYVCNFFPLLLLADVVVLCSLLSVPNTNVSDGRAIVPVGTKVSYTCLTPYQATSGATTITCLEAGNWSATPAQCYRKWGDNRSSKHDWLGFRWKVFTIRNNAFSGVFSPTRI
jgi:hypothetical protein